MCPIKTQHKLAHPIKPVKTLKYWIKQRLNPQIGTYYIGMGQMTKDKAKTQEQSLYGTNIMLSFDTEEDYEKKIKELKAAKENIQIAA
jgi:hypothetical protein